MAAVMTLKRGRSPITGRFVSLAYALANKATTVIETVKRKVRS